jgi:hypothetical protein
MLKIFIFSLILLFLIFKVSFSNQSDNSNMLQIKLKCIKEKDPKLCDKVKIAFNNAAVVILNTFELKEPITVNASFTNLCNNATIWNILGSAGPSKLIPLKDEDEKIRLYPQALVKQFQLSNNDNYEFIEYDIIAEFNSEFSFWFRGDPEINSEQVDFELVLIHELLHGLGFLTSWDDYLSMETLSPIPSFLNTDAFSNQDQIIFTGFQEFAMDKYLVFTNNNSSLGIITDILNQFSINKTEFNSMDDFKIEFANSPQFIEAKKMFNISAKSGMIAFRNPNENLDILMETSLVPFMPGSSISHLDRNTVSNTLDFLMKFKAPYNVTLDDITSINGNNLNYTNPIGPLTIKMLKSIG